MILLRDSKFKTFFALLGVVGGVLSIGYAEFNHTHGCTQPSTPTTSATSFS